MQRFIEDMWDDLIGYHNLGRQDKIDLHDIACQVFAVVTVLCVVAIAWFA